ncbi:MAG: SMUG2 DNA glycosylase family protein [Bacteroidetes bacterium]|nr:MAG: SMUG2 DNA glycosylase family protein [Bacteroidota bacterium]
MTFAQKVLRFHRSLQPDWNLPPGFDLLYPYDNPDTLAAMEAFYLKFYDDNLPRTYILGINPGRFGAGITGVPFTDPIRLEDPCGIPNPFKKRPELSSVFVYQFIEAMGGPAAFYRRFYISSVSPLGFTKDGKNINYYDDKALQATVEPYIIDSLQRQLEFGCQMETVIILGQGKNFKYFEKLNAKHGFWKKAIPLPHPRWVMQYRRKKAPEFVAQFVETFHLADGAPPAG